jgi:hypothetical protein
MILVLTIENLNYFTLHPQFHKLQNITQIQKKKIKNLKSHVISFWKIKSNITNKFKEQHSKSSKIFARGMMSIPFSSKSLIP